VLSSQLFTLKIFAQALNARVAPPPSTFGSGLDSEPSIAAPRVPPPPDSTLDSPFSPESISFLHGQKTKPSVTSFRSEPMSTSLVEPVPLSAKTVRYALDILSMYQCGGPEDVDNGGTEMYPWHDVEWDPVLHSPAHLQKRGHSVGKVADTQSQSGREETDRAKRPNQDQDAPSGRGNGFTAHDGAGIGANPGGSAAQDAGMRSTARNQYMSYAHNYVYDEALHGSYFKNMMVLVRRWALFFF
jgi:hypothetical protein